VSGFPALALSLPPAVLQQSLATLFPYLEKLRALLSYARPVIFIAGSMGGINASMELCVKS
jgi:hypothetical protein